MPRRGLSKSDFALLVNLLLRTSPEEHTEAQTAANILREGAKKPKKAAKPKVVTTT